MSARLGFVAWFQSVGTGQSSAVLLLACAHSQDAAGSHFRRRCRVSGELRQRESMHR